MTQTLSDLQETYKNSLYFRFDDCSALQDIRCVEAVQQAHDLVMDPIFPLYDLETKTVRSKCQAAFARIFQICDRDNDSHLSDDELKAFQRDVFQLDLDAEAITQAKSVLTSHDPSLLSPWGITVQGFICFQSIFLDRGDTTTVWTALRHYGYRNNLEYSPYDAWDSISPAAEGSSNSAQKIDESRWSEISTAGSAAASQGASEWSLVQQDAPSPSSSPHPTPQPASTLTLSQSTVEIVHHPQALEQVKQQSEVVQSLVQSQPSRVSQVRDLAQSSSSSLSPPNPSPLVSPSPSPSPSPPPSPTPVHRSVPSVTTSTPLQQSTVYPPALSQNPSKGSEADGGTGWWWVVSTAVLGVCFVVVCFRYSRRQPLHPRRFLLWEGSK
eukprot:c15904_g1_i1.p1 GENE.c15904_g1_i1~~c15904_g1_i1.p1  ORF type:complete len:383 (+),score=45.92 c15904_g1_i1:544-1692(+)